MIALSVSFPEEWAALPVLEGSVSDIQPLVEALGEISPEAGKTADAYFTALLPALSAIGVDGFAALALPDEQSGSLVQAWCAVGIERALSRDEEEELHAVAEGGVHPGLERDTTTVELPLGTAVRSSAVRWAGELVDDDGIAPYAAEVRFAFRLPGDRIGILHFETLSLVYLDELERLFDAIAATARLS